MHTCSHPMMAKQRFMATHAYLRNRSGSTRIFAPHAIIKRMCMKRVYAPSRQPPTEPVCLSFGLLRCSSYCMRPPVRVRLWALDPSLMP